MNTWTKTRPSLLDLFNKQQSQSILKSGNVVDVVEEEIFQDIRNFINCWWLVVLYAPCEKLVSFAISSMISLFWLCCRASNFSSILFCTLMNHKLTKHGFHHNYKVIQCTFKILHSLFQDSILCNPFFTSFSCSFLFFTQSDAKFFFTLLLKANFERWIPSWILFSFLLPSLSSTPTLVLDQSAREQSW